MRKRTGTSALWLGIVLAATPAVATENVRKGTFRGVVDVSADGAVRVVELTGVSGALARAVGSQIEARRAQPALRDGAPVATRAPLSGNVMLVPEGERVGVQLEHVAMLPGAITRHAFAYPIDAMRMERAGWVEVEFTLDASGMPIDVRVVHASHRTFAKALMGPLSKWRVATDAVEPGRRFRMAATFSMDAARAEPAFQCPIDAAYARFDAQPGCLDTLSVHGSRVYGGHVTLPR